MECPQEMLPWSRPHSSFNTGRKIKRERKKKQSRVWRREESRVRQNCSLLPCLTRGLSDCPAFSQCSPEEQDVPGEGSAEEAETP